MKVPVPSGCSSMHFKDAYERTVITGGGFCNLLPIMRAFFRSLFRPATEARCFPVNPSHGWWSAR